tara:strand:- start:1288 stop:1467 length:180 start_codon:yes stop_codon:yes gene_type:complete
VVDGRDLTRSPNHQQFTSVTALVNVYMFLFGAASTGTLSREDIINRYIEGDLLLTKAAK